jgi:hypothetical protein
MKPNQRGDPRLNAGQRVAVTSYAGWDATRGGAGFDHLFTHGVVGVALAKRRLLRESLGGKITGELREIVVVKVREQVIHWRIAASTIAKVLQLTE